MKPVIGRAEAIARAVAEVGLERIMRLEDSDPQLLAVARVAGAHGPGVAAVSSVLVALASYRLGATGEEWWSCYGDWFEREPPGRTVESIARAAARYVAECPLAGAQREAKARRILRAASGARGGLERLLRDPASVLEGVSWLLEALASALRSEPWRKTVAFAGKMAYYSARTVERRPAPRDSVIPVDLRIACITYTSGIVAARGRDEIMRSPRPAIAAWSIVSERSGVPQYNLDSLLWLAGNPSRYRSVEQARRAIEERLGPAIGRDLARRLARELVVRPCRR